MPDHIDVVTNEQLSNLDRWLEVQDSISVVDAPNLERYSPGQRPAHLTRYVEGPIYDNRNRQVTNVVVLGEGRGVRNTREFKVRCIPPRPSFEATGVKYLLDLDVYTKEEGNKVKKRVVQILSRILITIHGTPVPAHMGGLKHAIVSDTTEAALPTQTQRRSPVRWDGHNEYRVNVH